MAAILFRSRCGLRPIVLVLYIGPYCVCMCECVYVFWTFVSLSEINYYTNSIGYLYVFFCFIMSVQYGISSIKSHLLNAYQAECVVQNIYWMHIKRNVLFKIFTECISSWMCCSKYLLNAYQAECVVQNIYLMHIKLNVLFKIFT